MNGGGEAASPVLMGLLRRIAAEDVTFNSRADGRISYRVWSSETEYVTDPRIGQLVRAGLAQRWQGSAHGKGGVDLTPAGRSALVNTDSPVPP